MQLKLKLKHFSPFLLFKSAKSIQLQLSYLLEKHLNSKDLFNFGKEYHSFSSCSDPDPDPDKADKSIAFFQALKKHQTQSSVSKLFAENICQNIKGLIVLYKIVFMIAKRNLLFNVGESLVVPAVKEIICTVMERDPAPVLRTVPLSDTTVKQQINKMGTNNEDQLCEILQNTSFSLRLDETTTSDNNALLMAYVHYLSDKNIVEDLLFCKCLDMDTKG